MHSPKTLAWAIAKPLVWYGIVGLGIICALAAVICLVIGLLGG